jgi:hypothetical protein
LGILVMLCAAPFIIPGLILLMGAGRQTLKISPLPPNEVGEAFDTRAPETVDRKHYEYVDDQGSRHVVDSLRDVPSEYRLRARPAAKSVPTEAPPPTEPAPTEVPPSEAPTESSPQP